MDKEFLENEFQRAAECAAAMLSRRPLSAAMLEKKLLDKQFSEEAAGYAVERMRVLHAVDDTAYAQLILRSYARKGSGIRKIRQEMWQRGIPEEVMSEVLEEYEPDMEIMLTLLDKKLRGDISDRKECEKAMAMLQRRGFTFSQIREAMAQYRDQCAE